MGFGEYGRSWGAMKGGRGGEYGTWGPMAMGGKKRKGTKRKRRKRRGAKKGGKKQTRKQQSRKR